MCGSARPGCFVRKDSMRQARARCAIARANAITSSGRLAPGAAPPHRRPVGNRRSGTGLPPTAPCQGRGQIVGRRCGNCRGRRPVRDGRGRPQQHRRRPGATAGRPVSDPIIPVAESGESDSVRVGVSGTGGRGTGIGVGGAGAAIYTSASRTSNTPGAFFTNSTARRLTSSVGTGPHRTATLSWTRTPMLAGPRTGSSASALRTETVCWMSRKVNFLSGGGRPRGPRPADRRAEQGGGNRRSDPGVALRATGDMEHGESVPFRTAASGRVC